jgi:hypothetical protein
MSGWFPPNLLVVNIGVVGAAANVTQTGLVLAAPGANRRLRAWCAFVGPNNSAQAIANWTWDLTDFPVTFGVGRIARPNFDSGDIYWPGGFRMPVNTPFGYALQSTFAAASFGITVGYTIEQTA